MQPDPELERWRREWQAEDVIAREVKQRVDRESRHMRRDVAMEIAVTVVMGGAAAAWAVLSRRTDVVVLAVGVWVFIAICWIASVALRRGTWEAAAATTAAFLELSVLRCRRKLQAGIVVAVFYVVILIFDLVWIYFYRAETNPRAFLASPRLYWAWAVTFALAAIAVWYRRRLQRQLQNLSELQRQLAEGGRSSDPQILKS